MYACKCNIFINYKQNIVICFYIALKTLIIISREGSDVMLLMNML